MKFITHGTGVAGGIMAQAPLAIWHATSCTRYSLVLNWDILFMHRQVQAFCSRIVPRFRKLLNLHSLHVRKSSVERHEKNAQLPQVDVYWYDGGIKMMLPDEWPDGKNPNDQGGGVIFHGTKDKLVCGCYGVNPWLISGRKPDAPKFRRRVETSHEMDWARACKESPENRVETASAFHEAGPFNEMVVMGVLAVRLQSLNKVLDWDGENMQFTNLTNDETIRTVIRDGFRD
jgi:hypothetical protein